MKRTYLENELQLIRPIDKWNSLINQLIPLSKSYQHLFFWQEF